MNERLSRGALICQLLDEVYAAHRQALRRSFGLNAVVVHSGGDHPGTLMSLLWTPDSELVSRDVELPCPPAAYFLEAELADGKVL